MENRYLRRVGRRELSLRSFAWAFAVGGVALMGWGFSIASPAGFGGVALLLVALALWVARVSRPSAVELRLLVDTGNIDEAEPQVIAQLAGTADVDRKTELLLLLGRCAELRADFEEAGGVYESALGAAGETTALELRDRRAFCLAAAGRLDDAAVLLGTARGRERPFRELDGGRRPLEIRARCVTAFRSGDHATVLDLVERSRSVIETELLPLDRALVFSMEHVAALALGKSGARLVPLDATTTTWIGKLIPSFTRYIDG